MTDESPKEPMVAPWWEGVKKDDATGVSARKTIVLSDFMVNSAGFGVHLTRDLFTLIANVEELGELEEDDA